MSERVNIPNDWKEKVSNIAQLGGIETSVLDNGSGRGNRIVWINTGSGLRFKVELDRGMDIAEAFFNQYGLSWLSKGGFTKPQLFPDKGIDWLRTFGGGLLTTCGLSHVGGPESDEFGERGLHGLISNTPAELVSIIQPDIRNGNTVMSITGKMLETSVFGPHLALRRTISSNLGEPVLRIEDEVTNLGNTAVPLMLLYHFNFGYPLLDEGAEIFWEGKWQARFPEKASIFKEGNSFKTCPPPMYDHNGFGEEVAFIEPAEETDGFSYCGIRNKKIGLELEMKFKKTQLPKLCNWQHWGSGEYVTGIEPGTNWPIGQKAARENGELVFLQPNEKRKFSIEIKIKTDKA